jgi:Fructose-bisphosphate aldolase class-II
VGNLYGRFPVSKQLDLDLLRQIRDAIDINISGGSGTPGHYFEAVARIGVSKVNVNSDLRYAYRTKLEHQLGDRPDEYALVKADRPGDPSGPRRGRDPDRPLGLDRQSAAVRTLYETRPTATGDPIDDKPFVARRKLQTKMPARRHRLLREDAA